MIIVEKNEGRKIPYEVSGTKIIFDDEAMYNLTKYERDDANHLDICRDAYGNLVNGVPDSAGRYVAQIDIPGRSYIEVETGQEDEDGQPIKQPQAVPLDMDQVALTLWSVEG